MSAESPQPNNTFRIVAIVVGVVLVAAIGVLGFMLYDKQEQVDDYEYKMDLKTKSS